MKCVVCDANADYVSGGSSYCKKHLLKDVRIGTESSESNDKIVDEQKAMEKEPLNISEGWGSTS
ncbi:MAG: hypothetical protein V1645_03710 [archaeon]